VVRLQLEPVFKQVEQRRADHRHRIEGLSWGDHGVDVEAFFGGPRRRVDDLARRQMQWEASWRVKGCWP
jgi:hypothetical protein